MVGSERWGFSSIRGGPVHSWYGEAVREKGEEGKAHYRLIWLSRCGLRQESAPVEVNPKNYGRSLCRICKKLRRNL